MIDSTNCFEKLELIIKSNFNCTRSKQYMGSNVRNSIKSKDLDFSFNCIERLSKVSNSWTYYNLYFKDFLQKYLTFFH